MRSAELLQLLADLTEMTEPDVIYKDIPDDFKELPDRELIRPYADPFDNTKIVLYGEQTDPLNQYQEGPKKWYSNSWQMTFHQRKLLAHQEVVMKAFKLSDTSDIIIVLAFWFDQLSHGNKPKNASYIYQLVDNKWRPYNTIEGQLKTEFESSIADLLSLANNK